MREGVSVWVLKSKLIRNGAYNLLAFAVPLIFVLALTPLLVRKLGYEMYGLWALSTAMLGLFSLFDLGLSIATAKYVAELSSSGDREGLSEIVTASWFIYTVIGLGVLMPPLLGARWLAAVFGISPSSMELAVRVLQITSLGLPPQILRGAFFSIPNGFQDYSTSSLITLLQSILSILTAAVIVELGGNILQVTTCTVALIWLAASVGLIAGLRFLKRCGARFRLRRNGFRKVLSFSLYAAVTGIGNQVFGLGDRFIVGGLLGAASVPLYVIPIGIAGKILSVAGLTSAALMPRASARIALEDEEGLAWEFGSGMRIVSVLSMGLGAVLFAGSHFFLEFWMGTDFADRTTVIFRIMIAAYSVIAICAPAYHVVNGVGAPWLTALASLGGAALMVGTMIILVPHLALEGAALANFGSFLDFVFLVYLTRRFRLPTFSTLLSWMLGPLLMFVLVGTLISLLPQSLLISILLSASVIVMSGSFLRSALLDMHRTQRALQVVFVS